MEQDAYMKEQLEACVDLWGEVIAQAVRDITSSPKRARDRRYHANIEYFQEDNKDFIKVCRMACCEPIEIIKRVRVNGY